MINIYAWNFTGQKPKMLSNIVTFFTGQAFVFSLGNIQILHVNQPDIVRQIATYTSLDLGKSSCQQRELYPLLGQGILSSNGAVWTHNRKILAPELNMEEVKV